MLKRISRFLLIISVLITGITICKAEERVPSSINLLIENFVIYLEDGSDDIYSLVDETNTELIEEIEKYSGELIVNYNFKNVSKKDNNTYVIKTTISAYGDNWSVSGFTSEFVIEKIDGKYLITETNLFKVISPENISKFVFSILGFIALIFLIIIIVILVTIFIVKKKKTENYTGV